MKVLFLTNEYPPRVYGGAGVHVDYLSRELCRLADVRVFAFGEREDREECPWVTGFGVDWSKVDCEKHLRPVFGAIVRCVDFNLNAITPDVEVVHCHTWYSHLGGILAKLIHGIPMVLTVHSLEPLRPWKRDQLGGGYDFSSWVEETALEMADAVIAVSEDTNIDPTQASLKSTTPGAMPSELRCGPCSESAASMRATSAGASRSSSDSASWARFRAPITDRKLRCNDGVSTS